MDLPMVLIALSKSFISLGLFPHHALSKTLPAHTYSIETVLPLVPELGFFVCVTLLLLASSV